MFKVCQYCTWLSVLSGVNVRRVIEINNNNNNNNQLGYAHKILFYIINRNIFEFYYSPLVFRLHRYMCFHHGRNPLRHHYCDSAPAWLVTINQLMPDRTEEISSRSTTLNSYAFKYTFLYLFI